MILSAILQDDRTPVILLHGLYGASRNLGMISRALAQSRRVASLDLRNHGASPHAPDMRYTTMGADVIETMDGLGIAKATVIGHSMGGKVAMMVALRAPERVTSLVVMDIAPIAYREDQADSHGGVIDALRMIELRPGLTRRKADATLAARIAEPALRAFLLHNLVLGDTPHWRIDLDAIGASLPDLVDWRDPEPLTPYPGPALFLHGARSDYVPASAESAIRARFPGAEIKTIPNAGHWLHAEQPDAVVAALQDFLAKKVP